ncbi:MAG: NAD-dependent succinate-semialdehyde dehydrogenase [Ignavibacterium sp.]|nr:NAD-dependent succinate-semialdehyde dehydrogenase [Ignavibacterium sp.]
MLNSVYPFDNSVIKFYEEMKNNEVDSILKSSQHAFESWRKIPVSQRAELLKNAGSVLRNNIKDYSELMTIEMGKPIVQSRAEVEKCAWVCDYYSENAEKFLNDEIIETDASKSFVSYQPLGVILAVMPWNFPLWQVIRFAAPTLTAGNTGVLKHSSNVTGCALALEDVFKKAGFPENVFRTLLISSKHVKRVIENPIIQAVSITGSVPAGKAVASAAGSVLKKCVLELGGSDPYVVFEDADLESAADLCVISRLINGGQSCISAKRFIIVESVFDKFEKLYLEKMSMKKMGDPFNESNDIGPQASIPLRDELHDQVLRSVKAGAKLLLGGEIPDGNNAFYPPTVLTNVIPGMPAFDEELFGPVAALIKAKDADHAIKLANQTIFGLGAAVFTNDVKNGERIAKEELLAGNCFVNQFVKSDPRLPFGGVKESGYGRELSPFGIKEFVNIKTVYVK